MAEEGAPSSSPEDRPSPVGLRPKFRSVIRTLKAGLQPNTDQQLHRSISMRQLCCMALGSSIGAGMLVASGIALVYGGPGTLVLGFGISGGMAIAVMGAVGETSTSYPVNGAFYDHAVRFISPAWGFAMGWNFVINWLIILPFELTILAVKLQTFFPDVNVGVFIAIFLVVLTAVGMSGASSFAEVEHWAGIVKAVSLTLFILIALSITTFGIPGDPRGAVGTQYWHNPGAFLNGLQGFLIVFIIAGVSYGGSEVLALTVAECRNPRRMVPLAVKLSFVRILGLCVCSLVMAGFILPSNAPLESGAKYGAHVSIFSSAMQFANLPKLAMFYNVVIVIAVLSMGNTAVYASSRALQALCEKGMGPRPLGRVINWQGLPVYAVVVAVAFGCLAFLTIAPVADHMFLWLLSIAGLSNYLTWGSILLSQIRLRRAMAAQNRNMADLLWHNPFGTWGSYIGLVVCVFGAFAPIVTAFWPVEGGYIAENIVRNLLAFVVALVLWLGYHFHQRRKGNPEPWLVPLADIDLDTGRRAKEDIEEVSPA